MSEYQCLAFRAMDRPLTERELAFARKQSTRAESLPWSFENEYHFGDFHGDAERLVISGPANSTTINPRRYHGMDRETFVPATSR